MTKDSYDQRYPSYDVWVEKCRDNPIFKGADWSRVDLLINFYEERIL